MAWVYLLTGLLAGVMLTLPALYLATRSTAKRVARLERRALAAERLAEFGTLTGGLAHEIKNPLSTIGLNVQLLREDLVELAAEGVAPALIRERAPRLTRRMDSLVKETQRLRDILDDFLRFAGRVKLDKAQVDINSLIGELADFFEPQVAAAKVQLRRQLSAAPAVAEVDAAQLKQAVLNLLINAVQAMTGSRPDPTGDGRSSPAGSAGNDLILRTERKRINGQDEVLIHVIDTGPGIAPEARDKVFQPYFSTKKSGTGLGLPTSRRIVEEHGGSLSFHSEVGRGTDFIVALPASGANAEQNAGAKAGGQAGGDAPGSSGNSGGPAKSDVASGRRPNEGGITERSSA